MSLIAKYKFDSTLYADLIPEFNEGYTGYTISDEVDGTNGNHIIRTIECDALPTRMQFGQSWVDTETDVKNKNRCNSLLEILDMNTSELTSMFAMFRNCQNLTSVICNWDTSKVTNMNATFQHCYLLTSIGDVSNFNTSNVISMNSIFYDCQSLTSLDVSKWDTSNVTNMYTMFYNCTSLTSLDVSNWNTSNVTTMRSMFNNCQSLTSLDVSNFNTSNVTDMTYMFQHCNQLTSLDVSKWDTSSVINMANIFTNCNKLTSLDVSNWVTSKVTNMYAMFRDCKSLTSLDVSNFNTSNVTDMSSMFNNTPLLTDIGMLYCSLSTIDKMVSNLPTDVSRNIWVGEGIDILSLTTYDNISYKLYGRIDKLQLNSPLLEGDKIIKMNGKMYHYHKMGKVVFDGSKDERWDFSTGGYVYRFCNELGVAQVNYSLTNDRCFCDTLKLAYITSGSSYTGLYVAGNVNDGKSSPEIRIRMKEYDNTVEDTTTWLSENPTTVVYELANPYYELISDDTLHLQLEDININKITNNSIVPTNMIVENRTFSTVALKSNTMYTVAFDKSEDAEVTIDLGGTIVTTSNTEIQITTPNELAREDIIFYGDNEISNLRVIEGNVVDEGMPMDSFEGLKSSFEDGYIPSDNLLDANTWIFGYGDPYRFQYEGALITRSTDNDRLTLVNLSDKIIEYELNSDKAGTEGKWANSISVQPNSIVLINTPHLLRTIQAKTTKGWLQTDDLSTIILLEGNYTHLLPEDFISHLGKYKVEYKVIGKNKIDVQNPNFISNSKVVLNNKGDGVLSFESIGIYTTVVYVVPTIPGHSYIFSIASCIAGNILIYDGELYGHDTNRLLNATGQKLSTSFVAKSTSISVRFSSEAIDSGLLEWTNIQLEEGTVATSYEPYKEDVRTYYLSSPLLEGDTIEDIDGVATHVKRYEKKVVPPESATNIIDNSTYSDDILRFACSRFLIDMCRPSNNSAVPLTHIVSDIFPSIHMHIPDTMYATRKLEGICPCLDPANDRFELGIWINKYRLITPDLTGFKQWLSQYPVTVVYELAEPQYEPISNEPLLLNSYANGDLTFDTNITLDKITFKSYEEELTYLYPSKVYTVQFYANSDCTVNITLGGTKLENISITSGLNTIQITTPSTLVDNMIHIDMINGNATISEVVVTDSVMEYDYFEGIKSSFEDRLITDENSEYYGKYEVRVKVIGENKEYNSTIYLNSPLLQGDKIVVKDGKLCHYHKMGTREHQEGDLDNYITDLVNTVYELAEPYYEDIIPIQSSFDITTANEGDLEILTDLPIKSNIKYLTNVTSAIVLEQQLDEVDNTQSLSEILDEEINE